MKKLLALLLVIVLSLGVLVACGNNDEALAGAAEYLDGMYKKNNGEETPRDYNVVGKIIIDEETFTITWTTNSDKVSVKESDKAGFWTIDVPEVNATAFTYEITAKIANEDGDTVEKTFTKTMPVVTKDPTTGDVKENTAYKFYLYQRNLKSPLFATHTLNQDKYYATTESWDEAPDFFVEAVEGGYKFYTMIDGAKKYVNAYLGGDDGTSKRLNYADTTENVWTYNSETNGWYTNIGDASYIIGTYTTYNTFCISESGHLTAANSGKTQFPAGFVPVENKDYIPAPEEAVIYQTPEEIVNAAYALAKDEILSAGHKYTLTGVITKIDSAWSDQYGNITVSIVVGNMTDKPIQCFRTSGDGAKTLMVGDTITASGVIKNYGGTVEMEYAELKSVVKKDYTDAEKLAYEKNALTIPTDIKKNTVIELPATGATFNTVAITWSASGTAIENGNVNVTLGDTAIEFTLTATLTCGTETAETKEFTVKVAKAEAKVPVVVTAPVAGTAYKFGMVQGNLDNAIYYLAGGMAQTYYLATTDVYASGIDVYLEETTGGYYLYTTDGTTKTYINMVTSESDGTVHVNGAYEATPSTVYTYDSEKGTVVVTVNDEAYWFGTRNDRTFTTVGPVKVSYNGFYCQFYTLGDYVEPEDPDTPAGDITVSTPEAGTAYKLMIAQNGLSKTFYFNGATESATVTYRLALTENVAEAVDVYVETVTGVDGAYRLYFDNNGTKTYIVVSEYQDGDPGYGKGTIKFETSTDLYYTYDATAKTLIYTAADGENAYYMGTHGEYTTISSSNAYYITGDKASTVDATQFPARLVVVSGGDDTTGDDDTTDGDDTTTELTTPEAIVDAAYALANGATLENGPYTLTGVVSKIDGVTSSYVTLWIVVADKTDKPLQCYHLSGTGFDLLKVGDTVTVTGEIKNYYTSYNDTATIEFDSPTLTSYAFAQTTDADKVADAKADISVIESVYQDTTVTLPTTSARHDSVTITWDITEDANSSATLTGAELAIALKDTASTLTLTATIASGSATDTLVVEIALAVKPAEGAAKTDGRFTEETAYYLAATAADGTVYYFNGTVSNGKGSSTTNKSEAIELYVEIVDGGYYLYSVSGTTKTYYSIGTRSTSFTAGTDAVLLTWNDTYETLQGDSGRMFWFYGSASDFRTYSSNNGADTNKPTSLIVAE